MIHGNKQQISIATINDKFPQKTRCILKNEEGLWKLMPSTNAIIRRDGNVMDIQCVNALQTGENYVNSELDAGVLALDVFTIIGIFVDSYHNSFHEYPPFVTVLMKDKKDFEYIDSQLQDRGKDH
jgi:hypothetical protein